MNQRQFLLSSDGVSLLCSTDTLLGWVEFIIDKGGVPVIQELKDERMKQ